MTDPPPLSDRAACAAPVLYVSDVDHTLLGSDGTLSRYSRDTLNSLLAAGMQFTVASARSCASLRHLLAGLHLTLPVVDFNGSFVSDLATGRHHVVHAVPPALLGDLWSLVKRSGHMPFVSTRDGRADRLYYDTVLRDAQACRAPVSTKLSTLIDRMAESRAFASSISACGLQKSVVVGDRSNPGRVRDARVVCVAQCNR